MLLTIDTLDTHGKAQQCTCSVAGIEDSADFLHRLLGQGSTLLLAHVRKDNRRMALPLDAFTASSPESIATLLQHWQAILSALPLSALPQNHTEIMIGLTRRRINQYLFILATHERMISYYNRRIQEVQKTTAPQRADRINRENNVHVVRHQRQVNQVRGFINQLNRRLNQLSA